MISIVDSFRSSSFAVYVCSNRPIKLTVSRSMHGRMAEFCPLLLPK